LTQKLVVLQSLWAMERRHTDGIERSTEQNVEMILEAGLYGRVASREQVQVEISFPHNKLWLELFLSWWEHGFKSWKRRAHPDESLAFVCELGPKPYAIAGPDGNDASDRWMEALMMKDAIRALWNRTAQSAAML
jgi:hypothetical protein